MGHDPWSKIHLVKEDLSNSTCHRRRKGQDKSNLELQNSKDYVSTLQKILGLYLLASGGVEILRKVQDRELPFIELVLRESLFMNVLFRLCRQSVYTNRK